MEDFRQRLTQHLHKTLPSGAARCGDFDLNPDLRSQSSHGGPLVSAAVLVPLVERADEIYMLLTRRSDDLPSHAGQVSFPGGKAHEDDMDATATALRETHEEVGIQPSLVSVIGFLDRYETRTGFSILPVVGMIDPSFSLKIDDREVAEVFEVPVSFLMNPANHQRHSIEYEGTRRFYYAISYKDYYIWGATAGMLKSMYDTLYEL